jgi:hypothetical protein
VDCAIRARHYCSSRPCRFNAAIGHGPWQASFCTESRNLSFVSMLSSLPPPPAVDGPVYAYTTSAPYAGGGGEKKQPQYCHLSGQYKHLNFKVCLQIVHTGTKFTFMAHGLLIK